MSKWIVDIHGDIEGDYEIIGKYVEPKTGHWIEEFNDLEGEVIFTCSSCRKFQLFGTDFCYHCGAKMVEPQHQVSDFVEVEASKLQEAYNKGFQDGVKATKEHIIKAITSAYDETLTVEDAIELIDKR